MPTDSWRLRSCQQRVSRPPRILVDIAWRTWTLGNLVIKAFNQDFHLESSAPSGPGTRVALTQQSERKTPRRTGVHDHTDSDSSLALGTASPHQLEQDKADEDVMRRCRWKQNLASMLNKSNKKTHPTFATHRTQSCQDERLLP